jgi:hypothetical protein
MEPFSDKIELDSLEEFADSVFTLIEKTPIKKTEYYPDALFLVDKFGNKEIIHGDDISDEKEIDLDKVVKYEFPLYIKESDTKWYACACLLENSLGYELLLIVYGDKHSTGSCVAKIYEEDDMQTLGEWEEISPDHEKFSSIIVPIRRGIVNQG